MLVSVTGGTGFVGAHSVAAIVRQGHRVRLLVRDESKVNRALAPLGVDAAAIDVVVGDVTEEMSVERLVRGADGVLHAASVYSFDTRDHARMKRVTERSTELVLAAARRHAAGPVVHVSTFGVLEPRSGSRQAVRTDSPVGHPREMYLATKAAAERIARRHQDEGAPVVITYPPALLGPHDPNFGDQMTRLRNVLRGLMPMWPLGGFPVGDVRDTAELHARLFTSPRQTPDRHFGPGRYLSTRRYVTALREVTGRRLPAVFLPARAMLPAGLFAGALQRVWPWHIPAEYGAVYVCVKAIRVGMGPGLGIEPRPVRETLGDAVRWLHEQGHVSARQAGGAAGRPSRALAIDERAS
jgi:nucleoside-diphosphate-sugar epimerase